ncbi:MAG: hypothetical protein ACI4WP_03055 [Bacilli bacterium]
MNMFDEINDTKKALPRLKTIEKEVGKYQFNGYQKFAIITYILCFAFGIILGNLFPTCSSTATLYSDACVATEFNFFLMILFWFVSFLFCLFFFAIGHIIAILASINEKMK